MGYLDEVEQIKQLKARYFRFMDAKDWDAFRSVFTDNVVMDTAEAGGGVVEGADAFLEFLVPALAGTTTVHQGHMPEITVLFDTEATGIWALQDTIWWPDGTTMYGYGHYHDTYAKTAAGWKISRCRLTRLNTVFSTPGPGRTGIGDQAPA